MAGSPNRNYPKHLDESAKQILDELHSEIAEHAKKISQAKHNIERPRTRSVIPPNIARIKPQNETEKIKLEALHDFIKEEKEKEAEKNRFSAKVSKKYTNPFGVSVILFDREGNEGYSDTGYSYPDEWPFDKIKVRHSLINLLISDDQRIINFWEQCAEKKENSQARFIIFLRRDISHWAWTKVFYESKPSDFRRKIKATISDIKSLLVKIHESHTVSGIADDELTNVLDARHDEVFFDNASSWNLWDERPLRFYDLLAKVLDRFDNELKEKSFVPAWYPTKMEGKSADKIFLARAIYRAMIGLSGKASYVLIADMASIILDETVTEEDVRKNLPAAIRKILVKNNL